jgi:hypothetical protein
MSKTITLRDVKTGEALYPDVLVTNTYDSEGNNLVSVLSKKADLVDGIVPLSQLPAVVVTGGDSLKGVIVNGVTGTLDPSTGSASVTITAKNIELSNEYITVREIPEKYTPIVDNSTLDNAISTLETNTVNVRVDVNNLVSVVGVNGEKYEPSSKIYISEAKSIKEAVDILDASLNQEAINCKKYADDLLEWAEKE